MALLAAALMSVVSSDTNSSNSSTNISSSSSNITVVTKCLPGQYRVNSSSCVVCEAGKFSNASNMSSCLACDQGKFSEQGSSRCGCNEGKYARLKKETASGDYYECFNCRQEDWCVKGSYCVSSDVCNTEHNSSHDSRCVDGRWGIGCINCAKGYYRFNKHCLKCESDSETTVRWTLIVPIILFCYMLYKISRKLTKESVEVRLQGVLLLSTVLTTFTWLQTATFVTSTSTSSSLKWPDEVLEISATIGSLANFDLASYTNFACTVKIGSMEAYQWLLVELALLCLLLLGMWAFNFFVTSCLGVLWCCNCACHCAYKFAEQFQHLLIQLMILLYLCVVSKITEIYNCPGGHLSIKPDTTCQWDNLVYQTGAIGSMALFLLFGLGPLVWIYQKLESARRRGKLDDPEFARINGMLYLPFRPKYFYFQLVVMCRKLALVLATNVLSQTPGLQIVGIFGVLVAALAIQLKARPFVSESQDRLEVVEICSTLVLMLVGMISSSELLHDKAILVLVVIIYSVTCVYILKTVVQLLCSYDPKEHFQREVGGSSDAGNKFLYAQEDEDDEADATPQSKLPATEANVRVVESRIMV